MTTEEIAYIAGFLEGEGCFFMKGVSPQISFSQTDEDVVNKIQSIIGGHVYGREIKLYYKRVFQLRLHGPKAIEIMKAIRPLMGIRRGQKIDEIIKEDELRIKNGSGKCRRGHTMFNGACNICKVRHAASRRKFLKVV